MHVKTAPRARTLSCPSHQAVPLVLRVGTGLKSDKIARRLARTAKPGDMSLLQANLSAMYAPLATTLLSQVWISMFLAKLGVSRTATAGPTAPLVPQGDIKVRVAQRSVKGVVWASTIPTLALPQIQHAKAVPRDTIRSDQEPRNVLSVARTSTATVK